MAYGTILADTITDSSANTAKTTDLIKGSAKAWVNFNGTGVVSIRSQYNVSSITDNGIGDYTINFTTPMVDSNYILCGSVKYLDDSHGVHPANVTTPFTTVSAQVYTLADAGTGIGGYVVDSDLVSVAIIR